MSRKLTPSSTRMPPALPRNVKLLGLAILLNNISTSVRVTAQRPEGLPDSAFWWIVRGAENLPVTLGGVRLPDSARLKLYRRDRFTAKLLEEFDLCDVKGTGGAGSGDDRRPGAARPGRLDPLELPRSLHAGIS